jgi:DNA-binding NtrC family response regulator
MAKKILVVDDIGEYAMVFDMYFPQGIESIAATSFEEAQAAFVAQAPIALAIVDVRLKDSTPSDSSGMELLSWIHKRHPYTPVIMMSAYQGFEYEMEALERGAYCFLRKPLQPELIKVALRGALQL